MPNTALDLSCPIRLSNLITDSAGGGIINIPIVHTEKLEA